MSITTSSSNLEVLSKTAVSGTSGTLLRVRHASTSTSTDMTFAIFLPSAHALDPTSVNAIYWLSGLTCDDTNFSTKAGAFAAAEREGVALVIPDTSPRGEDVPNDEGYDLGQAAGFYIDATADPWSKHFQMETYITKELPVLIETEYGVGSTARSICGHSMGGHGALTLAFKDPKSWTSVSAFAPICNPTECPWGQKAFTNYFGSVEAGKAHDATLLLKEHGKAFDEYDDILIDQGLSDQFLENQLLPENLEEVAGEVGQIITVRRHKDYDHSYYFIAAFIDDHVKFHSKRLKAAMGKKRAADAEAAVASGAPPFAETAGKPIKCKAMVARAAKQPMVCEEITVDPPKAGEVRVRVIANALCHTDIYTLDGFDPEGLFPCILGHEAGAIVESVGPGVTSVKPGDHVVPGYTPQCALPSCIFCMSPKTNLCPAIRSTQGQGLMPDGTIRFKDKDGNPIYHFMGCSTMSEWFNN